jgi:hypothetical protein
MNLNLTFKRTEVLDWETFFHPEKAEKKLGATALEVGLSVTLATVANLLTNEDVVMAGALGDAIRKAAWPLVDAGQALGEIASYIFIIRGIILLGMDRKKQGLTQIAVAGVAIAALYLLPGFGGIARMMGTELLKATLSQ